MATAKASDLPVIIVSGADSPRTRIGRGLESIGGMTAETLQRLSTAVGGVMKSPVVLMAKVGGLASPRAATLAAPPGSSLEERVYHLEIQMKSLEERFNSMAVVTELDLAPHSHKEKPRIAKSLLQEMEADRTLVKRVQILEARVNERMERFEKTLSSIQSRLDQIEFNRRESVAGFEGQESLSFEPQYYDAEQQSDNFEALEAADQNFLGAHAVPGEATGSSPTLKKLRVKESSSAAPTTAKHVEPLQETDAGKNDDFLEPQEVSTPVYSKEAFLTQPMKFAAPSSKPAESVHRDDAGYLPASSEQQLASTLEELHGSFVTESSPAAASAKFLEIARAVTAEKSTLAHASSEPQSTSALEEPREAFPEEPSAAAPVAKSEEHAQEDADHDKSGTTIAVEESPSPPTFEATQKDFTKEPLAAALDAKIAQEIATQGVVIIALPSSEPPVTSKSVEAPSVAVPSANSEEPAQEDTSDKSVTMTAARESPKEDFVKESLTSAPGAGPAHELSSQEDSSTTSDTALASSESPVASKSEEDPSRADRGANFEEPAQEDASGKSGGTIAAAEWPSAPSLEETQEESVKEFMGVAPSAESAQVPATQEDNDMQVAAPKSQMASQFVEEPSAAAPSADSEEPTQEDVADKTGTTTAATEPSLASSFEEPKEDFEKESMASVPSGEPTQEQSDMAIASSETEGASKNVEEALATSPSANSGECEHKADVDESGTSIASAESPLASFDDPQEDSEKESSATAPSAELAQELATQEDSSMVSAPPETAVKSKFAEDPSTVVESVGFEEPTREDVDNGISMTTATDSPLPISHEGPQKDFEKESLATDSSLPISHQGPQEDFEKESLATAPSTKPIHEPSSLEDSGATSDKALASSKAQVASKFVEEPSSDISSANSEEPTQEDGAIKSNTVIADAKSPSFEEPHEEKESMAAVPGTESAQELATPEDSDMAPFESQVASKFVEEPSSDISSANSEEPTQKDGAIKSDTVIADAKSPSFEEPHEEKDSMAEVPSTEPAQQLATQEDSDMAPSESQVASKFVEEPSTVDEPSTKFEEHAHENIVDRNGSLTPTIESPSMSSLEAHKEDSTMESLASGASAKVLEPTGEDESGESPIAFAPLEVPSPSFFGIPQEASSKEPLGTNDQPKEQEKSGIVLPNADSTLSSSVEEDNHATKEAEYKLAEDFKVHPEHIASIEKKFPESQSNLAHVGSEESLATEDSDDRLESDQSGEEFFDVEHDSGNFESWESDEPGEATGIKAVAQKETLVPASSVEPTQELEQEPDQAPARELEQEPHQAPGRELEQEPDQAPAREFKQEPGQAPARELEQDHESAEQAHAQEHEQQPTQEPEQEDLTRNSAMALPPSERQVTSKSGESQELLAEEPLAAVPSTKFEEANTADERGTLDLPLASTTEEPQIDSVVSSEKSLSSASFQQSGNPELSENLEHESSDTPDTSSTPQETLDKEPGTDAPTTENARGHDAGRSDNVHMLSEPQLEESKEALANEPVKAVPSSESTEPAQEVGDGQSGAIPASSEPQLKPTLEEPQKGFVKEPSTDAESASKSVDLEESLADEPSAVKASGKLAQESVADKISAGPVEESPLTSIAEESQNGNESSPVEGKHVKIIAEPTEVIPRTQSDLTHVESNPEVAEDATKLESQGSFLAFGATSMDSKEALAKEPLPSAKLLELFEEENNSGKRGPVLADSPMTSTVEEPQKPHVEEPLASAKSVPKGHVRRRGFVRSSSEPQFAYKLEEHRKALAKESSVAAIPSASKLGDEHAEEEFGDTQCLPFRILEIKHPRKESEFKLVEDVKSPMTKSETASSPYVLEPKPSKIKEKKKKEKKERKPDATSEEKERRLSLGSGEMERKSSLRAEEKDGKYSPRAEEKHKQPFRHLRDRLRHAFSVNKEP